VHELVRRDLVDELRLMIFPTVLGTGKLLFPEGVGPRRLQVVEARRSAAVALLVLRR
jgi:dihydrofolate reductase